MTKEEIVKYWIDGAEEDFKTMNHLYGSKDYSWTLFMGHLVIEKLLKAHYVKENDTNAPFLHDLSRIAQKTSLNFSENQLDSLDEITTFNIKTRYDDYKKSFRNLCTKEFTQIRVENIKELRLWLIERL